MKDPHNPPDLLPDSLIDRIRHKLLGPARDFRDPRTRHHISLIAFLAWVGLGADGLSSSAYGPEESYIALEHHTYLAAALAVATAITVFIISYCYSRIIEHFPIGGGGYLVATQQLGDAAGVISGGALLVDYVLTIAVSVAGGGEAIFSFLPQEWQAHKLTTEMVAIVVLILLNLRGVRESVTWLTPLFLVFIITHVVLIGGGILSHLPDMSARSQEAAQQYRDGLSTLGAWGLLLVFLRAYSMGGGTYTGIEAVSNSLNILREPKVETGKRTMLYMAISLAFTAGGLLFCYMLVNIHKTPGRTLNAELADAVFGSLCGPHLGPVVAWITIASEAVLLIVAAQTGFLGGPRIMANMAMDSWLPRRFAALSDRLTNQNGILLMGMAAFATLWFAEGSIGILLVMYSINVFVTFTLAQAGMLRHWWREFRVRHRFNRDLIVHAVGFILCAGILVVMVLEKFTEGGWVTLIITGTLIALCVSIRYHYRYVTRMVHDLDRQFDKLPSLLQPKGPPPEWDATKPTAILLVGGYGGLGLHIFFTIQRLFPDTFKNYIFVSVGAIDSEFFKEGDPVGAVEMKTRAMLERYVDIANKAGRAAKFSYRMGTDVAEDASELCMEVFGAHPQSVVFAGTLVFDKPHWWDRALHNETAYAIQRRLKFGGVPMVILPLLLRAPKKRKFGHKPEPPAAVSLPASPSPASTPPGPQSQPQGTPPPSQPGTSAPPKSPPT